jgi:hypothetical protein
MTTKVKSTKVKSTKVKSTKVKSTKVTNKSQIYNPNNNKQQHKKVNAHRLLKLISLLNGQVCGS